MRQLKRLRYLSVFLWLGILAVMAGCWTDVEEETCAQSVGNEKVGILFLQVGSDPEYRFDWLPQFMRNLYDFFPAGQMVGGPKEGNACFTVIHYADEIEAKTCGVAPGTPIDVFCRVYNNTEAYPVQSVSDIGMLRYINNCAGAVDIFWTQFMFAGMHSTLDPDTQSLIAGPVVTDPNGTGVGIEDFLEIAGFDWMHTLHNLPDSRDIHRDQLLTWWYGDGAADTDSNGQELTNIRQRLTDANPDVEFVFRHAWEAYLVNQDAYGNPAVISDSAETAIDELINQEKVGRIIVVHTYPAFSNMTQYGHDWTDEDGRGVSAVEGKTFRECVMDINDGYGPDTLASRRVYLDAKPFESHWEHPFPLIQHLVEEQSPCVPVHFAPAYGNYDAFGSAVIDLIDHTVNKYEIPQNASLRIILGHHGYYGGFESAQECDSYFKEADDLYARVSAAVKSRFRWNGKFDIQSGAIEYAEGGMGDDDPPTAEAPMGKVTGVAEEIDRSINGVYVNSQGALVDNGTDNYEFVVVIPYFFESESSDTLFGTREVLGNMIPPDPNGRAMDYYLRDYRDADGTEYNSGDLDEENFTIKRFDATGWPSTPKGENRAYNKGSAGNPTTVIVTGTILSLGDSRARDHLTDAVVKAIESTL